MKNCLFSSEKGYTLAFALGVILVLMILGAMFTTVIQNEMLQFTKHKEITQAYYLAEAGINHALWNLNNSFSGTVGSEASPVSLGAGSYYTVFDSSSKLLTSIGKVAGVTKKITVHVKLQVLPASFERAVSGVRFNSIYGEESFNSIYGEEISTPDDPWNPNYKGVFIHNASTDSDTFDDVMVMNDGSNTLNIDGYVVNDEAFGTENYLSYAYSSSSGGVTPSSKRYNFPSNVYPNAHWKDGIVADVELPEFDTSSYETKIALAKDAGTGDVTWSSVTKTYDPGTQVLISGDLTITGSTVQNSNPDEGAVEIVVFEKVTINTSTIGPKVHIIAGGGYVNDENKLQSELALEMTGGQNKNSRTWLGDETQFYSNGKTLIHDYVCMSADSQTTIISRFRFDIQSAEPDPTGYHINLEGIFFSKRKIDFTLEPDGGNVRVNGCVVAGNSGATSPDGQINFGGINHRLDLVFSKSFISGEVGAAFNIVNGAVLDYSTWREE